MRDSSSAVVGLAMRLRQRSCSHALLPRLGIYVRVFAGEALRFIRLFRATWRKCPPHVRCRILIHWREREPLLPGINPSIEIMEEYSGSDVALATTKLRGSSIQFASGPFAWMPDPAAMFLIAHELAHVYQWATGQMNAMLQEGDQHGADPTDDIEDSADEHATAWGFDFDALEQWRRIGPDARC